MPQVCFDKDSHTYTVDGKVTPSVTTITSAWNEGITGREPFKGISPFYAQRGTMVHEAIAMDLAGELDKSSLDPALAGFFKAYENAKFRLKLYRAKTMRIEEVLTGEGYCGTADLITNTSLIDWKTGKHHWTHWMQLAAYRKVVPGLLRAGCVYLSEDGTANIRWMSPDDYREGWANFRAALVFYRCKQAHTRAKNDA